MVYFCSFFCFKSLCTLSVSQKVHFWPLKDQYCTFEGTFFKSVPVSTVLVSYLHFWVCRIPLCPERWWRIRDCSLFIRGKGLLGVFFDDDLLILLCFMQQSSYIIWCESMFDKNLFGRNELIKEGPSQDGELKLQHKF